MGILSSIPFISASGSVLGITVSLLAVTIVLGLWVLMLMILHPLHAALAVLSGLFVYGLILWFGFNLWVDFFAFFIFYIFLLVIYTLFLRRILPLPKSDIELLIKLTHLKQDNQLSEEEFKAAKKRLLKL